MDNFNEKMKDFVPLPRKIKNDYLEGKLTKVKFDVLIWIWVNTNPYNGFYQLSYAGLIQDFRGEISYANARKIISSLRREQYIHFSSHKGRGGSFAVFPVGFMLTSGRMQTLNYLEGRRTITTQAPSQEQESNQTGHNSDCLNHNLMALKQSIIKDFSGNKITTSYNDNNKNNKDIDSKKLKNYSDSPIPVHDFFPKTYEQEQCIRIAKELGEQDMRYLLSCLNKYGYAHLERAWGVFRDLPAYKIDNKPKYFNRLVSNLWKQNHNLNH